jgi:hypothetical protein
VAVDAATLEFAYRHRLERMMERLAANPNADLLLQLDRAASLIPLLPFRVDLWKIQNSYYRLLENIYPKMRRQKEQGDDAAQAWLNVFQTLGEKLAVKVT